MKLSTKVYIRNKMNEHGETAKNDTGARTVNPKREQKGRLKLVQDIYLKQIRGISN